MRINIIAVLLLTFFASATSGQTVPIPRTDTLMDQHVSWKSKDPNGASLRVLLDDLKVKLDGKFDYELGRGTDPSFLDRACCIQGSSTAMALGTLLTKVLNDMKNAQLPVHYELTSNKIIIHEVIHQERAHPPTGNNMRVVPNFRPDYRANAVQPAFIQPAPMYEESISERFRRDMVRVGLNRPPGTYGYYSGYGNQHPAAYGGYYGGYGQYGYYANCAMLPDDRNCTHGDLWIDGPRGEKWLQGIDLYVDGYNKGPASKYNRWPNKSDDLRLPVGPSLIQLVRIADDMIVYEVPVDIQSTYVMKGNPNQIRVDQNRLEKGPFRKRIANPANEEIPRQKAEEVLRRPGGGF